MWPFIGASPDGVVFCQCCETGAYCHRGETIQEAVSHDKNFCLQKTNDRRIALDRSHAYYCQVQTQLFIMNVEYCDFCVCTFTGDKVYGLHVE